MINFNFKAVLFRCCIFLASKLETIKSEFRSHIVLNSCTCDLIRHTRHIRPLQKQNAVGSNLLWCYRQKSVYPRSVKR